MTCKKKHPPVEGTRAAIAALFERGKVAAAQHHRWYFCAHGNDCGLACEWLDKETGAVPSCADPMGPVVTSGLYEALKQPGFHCPRGRF